MTNLEKAKQDLGKAIAGELSAGRGDPVSVYQALAYADDEANRHKLTKEEKNELYAYARTLV